MSGRAQLEGHVARHRSPLPANAAFGSGPVHGGPWDPALSPGGQGVRGCATSEGRALPVLAVRHGRKEENDTRGSTAGRWSPLGAWPPAPSSGEGGAPCPLPPTATLTE
ncbi:hypothetical protein H8959_001211 [Pygathrix nigripes]